MIYNSLIIFYNVKATIISYYAVAIGPILKYW